MNHQNLVRLNASLDDLLEFQRQPTDEELRTWAQQGVDAVDNHPVIANTARGVAGAAVVGGGLYARGRAAQNSFVGPVNGSPGILGTMKQGASALRSDVSGGLASASSMAGRAGTYAKNIGSELNGASGGLNSGVKSLLAKLRGVKFASRHQNLVQLNASLDQLIQL